MNINPKVGWYTPDKNKLKERLKADPNAQPFAYSGAHIESISLYDALTRFRTITPGTRKGWEGSIFAYSNNIAHPQSNKLPENLRQQFKFSGVIFGDIDYAGISDQVMDKFQDLAMYVPCLLAAWKSHSGKLHVAFYDSSIIKDTDSFQEHACILLASLCWAIKKTLGFDLRDCPDPNKPWIDRHNCAPSQQLFSNHIDDFKWNNLMTDGQKLSINSSYLEQLKTEYPSLFVERVKDDIESVQLISVSKSSISNINSSKKYYGHAKRWALAVALINCGFSNNETFNILMKKCSNGDYSETQFTVELTKAINSSRTIDSSLLNWALSELIEWGIDVDYECERTPININIDDIFNEVIDESVASPFQEASCERKVTFIAMRPGTYMIDYIDKVCNAIDKYDVLTIWAPTGAGKTSIIDGYVNDNTNEFVPGLAKRYPKSVIVTPFNVTNHLYGHCNIVSTDTRNKPKRGQANVMVWDQFIKRGNEAGFDIVFIDESHMMFPSRTYRDSAVEMFDALRKYRLMGKKIVFISATPGPEIAIFNSDVLKFEKTEERDIHIEARWVNDVKSAMIDDISNELSFDRICIFSDRDVSSIYWNIMSKDPHTDVKIYHSEWRDNVNELRYGVSGDEEKTRERLINRVGLFTCIAFNGLNIKNDYENILIDIHYREGDISLQDVRQIIGRFRERHNKITVRIYVDGKGKESVTLNELFEAADVICKVHAKELINSYWEKMNDSTHQNVLKEIEWFYQEYGDLKYILGCLANDYKLKMFKKENHEKNYERVNPEKRAASNKFKQFVMSSPTDYDMMDLDNKYHISYNRTINYIAGLCENGNVMDYIRRMVNAKGGVTSNILMDTILDDVKEAVIVSNMSDEEWNEELSKRQIIINQLSNNKIYASLSAKFKKHDDFRMRFKGMPVYDVFDNLEDIFNMNYDSLQRGRVNGGKHTSKKIIADGVLYNSCKDVAEAYNKSVSWVTGKIKNGIFNKV